MSAARLRLRRVRVTVCRYFAPLVGIPWFEVVRRICNAIRTKLLLFLVILIVVVVMVSKRMMVIDVVWMSSVIYRWVKTSGMRPPHRRHRPLTLYDYRRIGDREGSGSRRSNEQQAMIERVIAPRKIGHDSVPPGYSGLTHADANAVKDGSFADKKCALVPGSTPHPKRSELLYTVENWHVVAALTDEDMRSWKRERARQA